ncbi:cache domain-containing protein, partial [bacterium]|nr:cache domain-containing protein [bacterium]
MNTSFRFKSLRARLVVWFLSVAMLCLISVVTVLYFQRAAIIRGREFEKLEILRDMKVRELNGWMEERVGDVQVVAGDEHIRGLEQVWNKTTDEWAAAELAAVSTARALLQRYLRLFPDYHEAFFIDATSGRVALSTDPTREGLDRRESPYFIEPMRTGELFIQDIYDSDAENKPTMAFSAPVFGLENDGEQLIGVLVMRADLERNLYPLIQDRTGAGETGETLIVNKGGLAVNTLRWHESAPLKLRIDAEPAMRAVDGETGIAETLDYRGERVLAAFTYIPLMEWGFVAKRDLAEVYAPIRTMRRDMIVLVFASLLVVLLVSIFLAGTIAGPIVGIGAIVRRFTEGDLEARCPTGGADEVATLG